MNVACPECSTVYRIDPARLPTGGVTTRCRSCGERFRVEDGAGEAERPGAVRVGRAVVRAESGAGEATVAVAAQAPEPEVADPQPAVDGSAGVGERPTRPVFGPQDPDTRARRLARALVSDIKVYNAERWEESRGAGTLRKDFRDEILKSWEEYVEQVGEPMAKKTPHFRDALNDILAGGERVF